MMLRAGPFCDVCGSYVLLDTFDTFRVKGIDAMLICHSKGCRQAMVDAGTDWTKLPPGPLRDAFAEAAQKQEASR